MDVLFLIGRILLVLLFIQSGSTVHLLKRRQGVEYARMYGTPAAEVTVPLTGVMAVVGGTMVVLGVWGDLGALILAAFLIPVTWYMHGFWRETDPMQRANQMAHFSKNVALLGGALVLFYVWNQLQGDAGLSLTDPLFSKG
jgi:putative oxidoreductase